MSKKESDRKGSQPLITAGRLALVRGKEKACEKCPLVASFFGLIGTLCAKRSVGYFTNRSL